MGGQRAVLFDLGGVLLEWNPRQLFRPLFQDEAKLELFMTEVCTDAWNWEIDAGKPFLEAIRQRQAEMPEWADTIQVWYDRWDEMLGGCYPETVALLEELKGRGTRLYALTNWYKETFPIARARFRFLDWFQDIVVSGVEGMAKPDPALFRLAAERCGLVPAQTLFVDDVQVNVDAARGVGFDAIRFTGAEPLCRALADRGFLEA